MPRLLLALGLLCLLASPARSQAMTTLVPDFPGNDGISVDAAGNIFVNARGSNFNGKRVIRVEPDGTRAPYATGLDPFPVGSVFDSDGNLYVTGANFGNVRRIAPDGTHEVVATGMPGAGGLEFDGDGNLYCSAFNANYVARIEPDSTITTFATGGLVNGPTGLAYHAATNRLYNANWYDGNVTRYELDGTAQLFATIPEFPIGPLVIVGDYLYASAPEANRVYRIELATAVVSVFAGTGVAGDLDGDLSVAQLRYPVGIGATHDGDLFYIADIAPSGNGRLRRIVLSGATGAASLPTGAPRFGLAPNPFTRETTVRYTLRRAGRVELAIHDAAGRLVRRLASGSESAGDHARSWDGRDEAGRPAAAGVYHVRLLADGHALGRRLVRLR
ncbi:hypothetical protein K8I85_16970 [bacterium]|nr:hypothetical protein [bacterium]